MQLPQTRFSYTSLQAYYNQGSGTVASGQPVYELTSVSQCQTLASCAGTADEVKATIAYGPQTAGVGNNLLPVSQAKGSGDGALTATVASGYDDVGNLLTVDGPLAGTGDTIRYRYNADRELVGTISADPDGAGPLKNRAVRNTIDARGLLTKVENGTTAGQDDTAWAAFAPAEYVDVTYDSSRRPITQKLSSGATAYALTQTSYNADGSVDCVATRMNPAAYGSLPASACTLGTEGSDGPDRIVKTSYDPAGQVTSVQVAYGTADQATERNLAYTNDGKLASLTDGENNKTSYVYDGFDRLSQTQYPSATKGAGTSNAADYEQLTYGANGNVTSRRLRDGNSIAFTYDNLNRVTLKDLPGTEPDVSYVYDLLGRMTSASQTGNALSFTYDALGRKLTETGQLGTATSAYDLAGNRVQLTLPGSGLYVNYDRLVTGEVAKIRENGASSGVGVLATYAYDDLGRRTGVTLGNGTSTSYAYDPVSRLASLTHDLAGTADDLTINGFAYNPASQIKSLTRSNDAYAFTGLTSGTTSTVTNGLNQLASVGGVSAAYDSKGNLTTDPVSGRTYAYSSENLLTAQTIGTTASLAYDPLLRLGQVAAAATTKFGYDGVDLVAEGDASGAIQRRYVPGDAIDEPIVWYEGSGITDRRFLHADERGSIVAITDSSGNVIGRNGYDEYGTPAASNIGRFQYTGQKWIGEVGLYDYKARMYSPYLPRFMQTDPIGFAGGINLYAYVANDPVGIRLPRARS